MRAVTVLAAAVVFLGVAACSRSSKSPISAMWSSDPTSVENPWPSDRLLVNGKAGTPVGYFNRVLPDLPQYQTARALLETAAADVASNGGFSVYAPVVIRTTATVSTAALTSVHLYPTASGSSDALVTLSFSSALQAVLVTPSAPLHPKTTYALSISGPGLFPSPAFSTAVKSDPVLVPLAADAVARGYARSTADLDLLFSFTTGPMADDLLAIQSRIDSPLGSSLLPLFTDSANIPNFPVGYFLSSSSTFAAIFAGASATTAGVAGIAQGTWNAFDFRRAADGIFDKNLIQGSALTPSTNIVDFRLCIPNGTPPAAGWPIVISSHGLTTDSSEDVARCSSFALAGIALIGQTAVDHGYRGSFVNFFNFTTLLQVRDNFRQSDAELLQMQRMLANGAAANVFPFNQLDTTHPHYWGNSLGSLFGGAVIATSSHLGASGLSVPGARLLTLTKGSAGILLLDLFAGNIGMSTTDPAFTGFLSAFGILGQMGVDPADPGALVPLTPSSRHVLLQESLNDPTILNVASDDLRKAFGYQLFTSPVDPIDSGALWIWNQADFPSIPASDSPHDLYWNLPPMRHQMETWINSNGTNLADPSS